ncbi:MAG: hypothetical protein AB8G22_06350 [Saprospiraceae bacterium]
MKRLLFFLFLFLFPLLTHTQNVSLDFDGMDDYIELSTLPLSTSDFTLESWFRSTDAPTTPNCVNEFRRFFL